MKNFIIQKVRLFLSIGIALLITSCDNEDPLKEIPKCIENKIETIKDQNVWNPPAKAYSYQYNGETVYYFTPRCCDIMSTLYDENCKIICSPDGGITGNGDNMCLDFFTNRTDEKLIWEDNRK